VASGVDRAGPERPRVAVVGGAGFIGAHLARRRIARGWDVHVLGRPGSRAPNLAGLGDRLQVHGVDLGDRPAVERLLARIAPRHVVHLAASTRRAAARDLSDAADGAAEDLGGMLSVVAAAAALPDPPSLFLRAGTLAEYGFGPEPSDEGRREAPADAYAAAMTACTHYLAMLQPRLPFPAMTARLALVYGPMQSRGFLMTRLFEAALARRPVRIERPRDRRDLLHVDDAVDALEALAAAPRPGEVVCVGSGEAPAMLEAARLVFDAAGADPALVTAAAPAPAPRELTVRPDRIAALWGWRARTTLREGAARTLAALRAAHAPA
jgi:nucleoside-diphosphate-sugar epimerase